MKADHESHDWVYEPFKTMAPAYECSKCGYRISAVMTPGTLPNTRRKVRVFDEDGELVEITCYEYTVYRIHNQ